MNHILVIRGDGNDGDSVEQRHKFQFNEIAIKENFIKEETGIGTPEVKYGRFIDALSAALEMGPNSHNWSRDEFDSMNARNQTIDNFCITCFGFNPSEIEWTSGVAEEEFYTEVGDELSSFLPYDSGSYGIHTIDSIEYYPETSSVVAYDGYSKHKVTLILSNGFDRYYFDTRNPEQIMFKMFNEWTTTSWESEQQIIDEMNLEVVYKQST